MILSLDIETAGLDFYDPILYVGVSYTNGEQVWHRAWNFVPDLFHPPVSVDTVRQELSELLCQAEWVFLHNATFDIPRLVHAGILSSTHVLDGKVFDTMLFARMLYKMPSYSLVNVCRYFGIEDPTWDKSVRTNMSQLSVESAVAYLEKDTQYTLRIGELLLKEAMSTYSEEAVRYENMYVLAVSDMIARGKKLSREKLLKAQEEVNERIAELSNLFYEYGFEGPGDRRGMERFLRSIDIEPKLTSNGNVSTDAKDAMPHYRKILETRGNHEALVVIEGIEEYRHLMKLNSTYIEPFLSVPDGIVHPGYTVGGTTTFRLSCSNPNAQNIPRELDIWEPYVSCDYSQAELRVAAAFSAENTLAKAFAEDGDIHTETALALFGDPSKRQIAKTINFAILYGSGAQRIAKSAGISVEEAREFLNKHKNTFPKLHDTSKLAEKRWASIGYITLPYGKRIFRDEDRMYKAFNNLIQGTVAELVQRAMVIMYSRNTEKHVSYPVVGQIHDSIELDYPKGWNSRHEIKLIMESVMPDWLSHRTSPPIQMKVDIEIKGLNKEEK